MGGELPGQSASEWKDAALSWVLHKSLSVQTLMYGNETMVSKEGERSKIRET